MKPNLHQCLTAFCLLLLSGCNKDGGEENNGAGGTIGILRVWSGQFPAAGSFNYLEKDGKGAAGAAGNAARRVLMGTRENSEAWAGAEISVSDPRLLSLVKVRFGTEGSEGPVVFGEGTLTGTTASVRMVSGEPQSAPLKEYALVAWIDGNGNGQADKEEPVAWSDGRLAIVNKSTYTSLLSVLKSNNLTAGNLPRATAFSKAFLDHQPISYGGTAAESSLLFKNLESGLQASLSYHVGVDYDATGQPVIRNYAFSAASLLARDLRASTTFRQVLLSVIEKNRDAIRNGNCRPGRLTFDLPSLIRFASLSSAALDNDLYYTFGTATLSGSVSIAAGCRTDGKAVLDTVQISGKLTDLYDFNYRDPAGGNAAVDAMALIQAGYGTLGSGGQIFRTEVALDTVYTGFAY